MLFKKLVCVIAAVSGRDIILDSDFEPFVPKPTPIGRDDPTTTRQEVPLPTVVRVSCNSSLKDAKNAIWKNCLGAPHFNPLKDLTSAAEKPETIENMCDVKNKCEETLAEFKKDVVPLCGKSWIYFDGTTALDLYSHIHVLFQTSCKINYQPPNTKGCYSSQMRFLQNKYPLNMKILTNLQNLRNAKGTKAAYCDQCILEERVLLDKLRITAGYSNIIQTDILTLNDFITAQCGLIKEPTLVSNSIWDTLENSSLVGDGSADVKLPVACQNALDDPINNIWTACLNRPNRFPVKDLVESARTIKIIGLLGTTKAAQCAINLANYKANVLPACGGNGQQIIFHEGDTTALDFYSEVDLLRRIAAIKLAVPAGADNCYHAQLLTLEDRLFPIDAKISTNLINLRSLRSNPSFFCGIGTNQCVALEFAELKTALNTAGYSKMVNDDIIELRKFISRACSLPLSEPVDDEVEVEPPVSGSIESIPGLLGVAAGAMSLLMV